MIDKLKTNSLKNRAKPLRTLFKFAIIYWCCKTVTLAMIQEVATRSVALPRKEVLVFLRS